MQKVQGFKAKAEGPTDVVGLYFISYVTEGEVRRKNNQGRILGRVSPGYFLAETYSWFGGGRSCFRVLDMAFLQTCDFFDEHEWFIERAEHDK